MTREELIRMPEYWTGQIQLSLYRAAESFMTEHHMNRTQLAAYLGVSKGYVSQLLNGDYNYSISKLVELAIKLNCVPNLELKPMAHRAKKEQAKTVVRRMASPRMVRDFTRRRSGNRSRQRSNRRTGRLMEIKLLKQS